jgi:signal transduction histidine kinase
LYQAQRREAIVALTGGIVHDFNNLHSVILGNLRFLKDDLGKVSDDIKEVLADAISATNDSVELTKRLMSYSRNQAVKPKMINVNHLVSELVPFLTSTLGNSIKLSTDLSPNILQINVDPDQLENALLNLVLNSKDAMPMGGGIVIKVSGGHSDAINYCGSAGGSDSFLEEGDYVVISVTDNGRGIKVENILAVFEPFFTTKDIGEGSGLGLSMVYGFCQQSNGNCTIDSDVGKATTVTMHIPRCDEG